MNPLQQIAEQIAQGNQNLEVALQALIKQEIENGSNLEVALQALIKQAEDLNLEPAVQALIKLQMENHDELMAKLGAKPEVQQVELMGAEIVTIKGKDGNNLKFEDLTDEQKEEIRGEKGDSVKGDKGDPLLFEDLTDEQKAELKGDDGEVTDEHIRVVVSRVTDQVVKQVPTADEVAKKVKVDAPKVERIVERHENKVTKKQIREVVKADLENGRLLTQTFLMSLIKNAKGKNRIDIDDVHGLDKFFRHQGGGGRGHPHTFLEAPDTPDTYAGQAGKYARVNSDENGLEFSTVVGGSGLTKETPAGAIDNSNVTFTVTNEPFFINVNGAIYEVGDGAYSSYVAGTITLAYPVGTGGFIKSYY